jgi:hypothetical protein
MGIFKVISGKLGASAILTHSIDNPTILYSNMAHDKLTGYTNVELIGESPKIFQGKNTNRDTVLDIKKSLFECSYWSGNIINYTKDGIEIDIHLLIFGIIFQDVKYFVVYKKLNTNKILFTLKKIAKRCCNIYL